MSAAAPIDTRFISDLRGVSLGCRSGRARVLAAGCDDPRVPDPSSTAAPEPRRATITRGFLFADLRGYTAFVERNGAHRAAAMLDRYRILVRSAVAEFDGAEIRTEGDSFYVVFDGASAAIECGLAIVAAAMRGVRRSIPHLPIHVGVGIHAGETVETTEGFCRVGREHGRPDLRAGRAERGLRVGHGPGT